MTLAVSASVSVRTDGDAVELLSGACGTCPPCRHGRADHCLSPGPGAVAVRWSGAVDQPDLAACAAAIRTVEALARSSAGPRIGVVGSGAVRDVVSACLAALPDVSVVEPHDHERGREEVRRLSTALRTSPSGRPSDVVVTLDGDLRLAGLLVRRGGAIVSPVPVRVPIPMTTLVQRELTIVPTLDMATRAAESPLLAELGRRTRERVAA